MDKFDFLNRVKAIVEARDALRNKFGPSAVLSTVDRKWAPPISASRPLKHQIGCAVFDYCIMLENALRVCLGLVEYTEVAPNVFQEATVPEDINWLRQNIGSINFDALNIEDIPVSVLPVVIFKLLDRHHYVFHYGPDPMINLPSFAPLERYADFCIRLAPELPAADV